MTDDVEAYLTLYGETKWIDLAIALRMTSAAEMRRLARVVNHLVHLGWVIRRERHGLHYYRLEI